MNYLKLLILIVVTVAARLTAPTTVRADDAAPLRIHMIGIGEYKPVESLTAFKQFLEERYRVDISTSFSLEGAGKYKDGTTLPDLEKLRDADVLVIFARRINLAEEQMAIVRNHWEQGKAIVAMRTSSHAFQPADNEIFDQKVLGGHYSGAADYKTPFDAIPAEGQAEHPVLKGVGQITSRGYYGNKPLAADTIVIQVNDEPQRKIKRPVTWLHEYRGGRTFYTSMGVPEDFADEDFRRLLTNAIFWTARRDVAEVKAQEAAPKYGRLEITVVEANSPAPVACRIHLTDPAGKPVEAAPLPFWRDHFVCPGTVQLDLPAGTYAYEIERGPEYARAVGKIEVKEKETAAARVTLERLVDLPAEGWWPGELHVHRPVADIELLMRAEDLYVAPVITWWNNRNLWADHGEAPAGLLYKFDGKRYYHVMAGEDEREGGALLYFNLPKPLEISGSGREFPSPMRFLADARQQKQKDVWVDVEKPFWWDVPVWLASGQVDSIGIANNHMWRGKMYTSTSRTTDEAWGKSRDMERLPRPHGNGYWSQEIYYHILNCGLRLPPSAGSASGVLPNPVGYNRAYVYTGDEFNYERWFEGLRAGRSFVTNGPLLRVAANGQHPGHVFSAAAGQAVAVELKAKLTSRDPVRFIEVIQNGRVVRQVPFADWERTGSLGTLEFRESGWFLVRALTDDPRTFCFASTAPWYVEIGSGERRISKQSAQFFVDWVVERQARVKVDDAGQRDEVLRHHREAEKFWCDLMAKASAE